jgi:hypothetical protein
VLTEDWGAGGEEGEPGGGPMGEEDEEDTHEL